MPFPHIINPASFALAVAALVDKEVFAAEWVPFFAMGFPALWLGLVESVALTFIAFVFLGLRQPVIAHPFPGACDANPLSFVTESQVFAGKFMASQAMGFQAILSGERQTSCDVFHEFNSLQVRRVNTGRVSAEVINNQAFRNLTDKHHIGDAMGQHLALSVPHNFSVAVGPFVAAKYPAAILGDGHICLQSNFDRLPARGSFLHLEEIPNP
jgi:hypothetical protein